MSDRADHREERERERIARTAAHYRKECGRGGMQITQTQAEAEILRARDLGRKKRGES